MIVRYMDSPPACTLTGDGEGGRLITGVEGKTRAMEGEEIVVIDDKEDERDADAKVPEPFACPDDDNDTDDNAVEVSLLGSM